MKKNFERNLLVFLLHFIKKQWLGFMLLAIACLANALSISIWPKIIEITVDLIERYSGDKSLFFSQYKLFFIGTILFWLLVEILTRVQGIIIAVVLPRLEANLKMYLYSRMLRTSYDFHIRSKVGSISNKIADLPRAAYYGLDIAFTVLMPFIISLIISSAFFFKIHWQLSIILFVWMSMHIVLSFIFCIRAASLAKLHARAKSNTQGSIVDSFRNILPIKLFLGFKKEFTEVQNLQEQEVDKNRRSKYFIEVMNACLGGVGFFIIGFLFWRAIHLWQIGYISIGSVLLVLTSVLNLWMAIREATEEIEYLVREIGVGQQSLDLLEYELEESNEGKEDLIVKKGDINFNKVTFNYKYRNKSYNQNYPSGCRIFDDKTVKIKGGQKIGLVGFSGSGKTTFAKLTLKLFDIESGVIEIDGQDISSVNLRSLRSNITFIPQEPILFNRTIFENIAYDKIDTTFEEVVEAAKKSYCHEFIMKLPEGYDTVVGERGSMISGGQRQRIMIARAIMKDAPIVIMDEATSALDTWTEKKIRDGLDYISKNKTTIVIAHRLSTLADVDRILVFKDGRIIEDGSHHELLKDSKYYKMLWSLQTVG